MEKYLPYISIDPEVRFGKPCAKGTRITIADILLWMASGMTDEEILTDFPALTKNHLQAALYYAAHRDEVIKVVA